MLTARRLLFHQLPHLLPNPFHILLSHPCLWFSKPLSRVPSILQDGLPNMELPMKVVCLTWNFPLGMQYSPASKGRAKGSLLLASCSFSSFFSFSWLAFSMLRFFLLLVLLGTPLLLGCPCCLLLLPILSLLH